jgi:hypothetical protein
MDRLLGESGTQCLESDLDLANLRPRIIQGVPIRFEDLRALGKMEASIQRESIRRL